LPSDLEQHLRTKHLQRYVCARCSADFASRQELDRHLSVRSPCALQCPRCHTRLPEPLGPEARQNEREEGRRPVISGLLHYRFYCRHKVY
jgi:DNA-directed RNA polymerase subunit RPC12/RpoP